jgi:hypothetical protein
MRIRHRSGHDNHSQDLESEIIAHGFPIRSLFACVHAPPYLLDDARGGLDVKAALRPVAGVSDSLRRWTSQIQKRMIDDGMIDRDRAQ